ncbi:AEC family transporter [Histidinibacterium aquaticum]|uniref:AEC family transporter n=1 Tax=Histidinibacterium aquaticum TaxID=2613962 RepID=A0A5J5GD18_9RHOB|nr:AEC family transporter [Histidinibacterium aquaticum]KAA9005961.1 AEC family transporter [Histidinibacterium aquaticum]
MLVITIWPIFALICLGYVLFCIGFPSESFWAAAERLNYFVLFPALLVSSLAEAPVYDPAVLRLGAAAIVTILLGAAAVALFRRIRPMPARRYGPVLQGVVRFNTYLGLSILAVLAGSEGIERAAIYLAVSVPLVNVLAILALSGGEASRHPLDLLRTVLTNPLILACLMGGGLALAGIGLPLGTGDFLSLLGQASLPLGLLCVGAALRPVSLRRDVVALLGTGAARLLAMPALATAVAVGLGLSGVEALVLVVFSAVPTAPSAYVLTRQLNGDASFMAGIVTSQTIAVIATLPLLLLVGPFG